MTSKRSTKHADSPAEETNSTPGSAATLAHSAAAAATSAFHALNDAESHYMPGAAYSTVRHTRPWVYYRGISTGVPITILGREPLPEDRRISLQRRGWRTGLLGWTVGGWIGGTVGKETDVTPQNKGSWNADVDAKRREQYDQEVTQFLTSVAAPKDHQVLETDFVHIPVSSGDGYFRLLVYPSASSRLPIASTASFRVGSFSLSSAHPRGASIVTLVPELTLKSGSALVTTAAWTSFYAAFPFVKVAQMMPGANTWGNWAMNRVYKLTGGKEAADNLSEKYQLEERKQMAEESLYRNVRADGLPPVGARLRPVM